MPLHLYCCTAYKQSVKLLIIIIRLLYLAVYLKIIIIVTTYVIRNRTICIIILFYHTITIKPRSTYTYSPSAYSKYCLSVYRVFSTHSMFIELIGI